MVMTPMLDPFISMLNMQVALFMTNKHRDTVVVTSKHKHSNEREKSQWPGCSKSNKKLCLLNKKLMLRAS